MSPKPPPSGAREALATFDPIGPLPRGVTLLEASAGTGKTFSITGLIVRLVVEHAVPVDRILAVTFTNLATSELTSRVRQRLTEAFQALTEAHKRGVVPKDEILKHLVATAGDGLVERAERAREAVESFDKAPIATIHGFCQRILQQHALDAGVAFDVELLEDAAALVDEIVEDFWVRKVHDASDLELATLDALGTSLRELRELAQRAVSNWTALVVPDPPEGPVAPPPAGDVERAMERAAPLLEAHAAAAIAAIKAGYADYVDRYPPFDYKLDDALRAAERIASRRIDPKTIGQLEFFDERWLNTQFHKRPAVSKNLSEAVRDLRVAYDLWLPDAQVWALALRHELVAYARTEARRRCGERRLWTFDDLLRTLGEALEVDASRARLQAAIGGHYQAVFIDEFQDTDPVQWKIFSTLFGDRGHWLFLIGDPKQAIYRFRRADIQTYLEAKERAERRFSLEKNHRSDLAVVDSVNRLFAGKNADAAARAFAVDGFGFHPSTAKHERRRLLGARPIALDANGQPQHDPDVAPLRALLVPRTKETRDLSKNGPPRIASGWAERELPRRVASDIARTLGLGLQIGHAEPHDPDEPPPPLTWRPLTPQDLAVLVRTNPQAERMSEALREVGVPAIVFGPRSVYASDEAEELVRVLRAILEPARTRVVRAALVTRLLGLTAGELARAERDDPRRLEEWANRLRAWQQVWTRRSFIEMFRQITSDATVRLLEHQDGSRWLANLLHLGELLHQAAADKDLKPAGLLQHLERARQNPDERDERQQLRLDRDDAAVQILTIHKAKGLEFPLVWVPYAWESGNLRPDERRDLVFRDPHDKIQRFRVKLDIGIVDDNRRQANVRAAEEEVQTEQLRLLYVALTRAKLQTTVVWGAFSKAPQSALGYLLYSYNRARTPSDLAGAMREVKGAFNRPHDWDLLRELGALGRGVVGVTEVVPTGALDRWSPPAPTGALGARAWSRTTPLDTGWRRTSFSGLVAELQEEQATQAAADEDGPPDDELAPIPADPDAPRLALADLQSGRMTGNALHKILELAEFATVDAPTLEALVKDELGHHGIDRAFVPAVTSALLAVLDTPLAPVDFTLRAIARERRLPELAFVFPVAGGHAGSGASFTVEALRQAFAAHGAPLHARWKEALARLRFADVRGFLSGSIDLAFRGPDGRYYVIDWKSNRLGRAHLAAEYAPERLIRAMDHHHYHLQYHLYTLAFDRFLRARLGAAYDYERDFGGVLYCFLRGMDPRHPPGTGVFFDRPSAALVEALAAAFDGGAAAAAAARSGVGA